MNKDLPKKLKSYNLVSKLSAITVSPPPRTSMYATNVNLYIEDKNMLEKLLRKAFHHFILYPEMDNDNRLHFHGTLGHCYDSIAFHRTVYPKMQRLGYVKMKPLLTEWDNLNWNIYCLKSWAVSRDVLRASGELQCEPIYPHKLKRTPRVSHPALDEGIFKYFPQ